MPSLHAGFALGVGIGIVMYARPLIWKVLGVLYPVAVVLTIVVTGNHFILDASSAMRDGHRLRGRVDPSRRGRRPSLRQTQRASCAPQTLLNGPRRGVEQSGSSPGS